VTVAGKAVDINTSHAQYGRIFDGQKIILGYRVGRWTKFHYLPSIAAESQNVEH
jgi:hypothetical protein